MLGAYLGMKGYAYDQELQQKSIVKQHLPHIAKEIKLNAGQVGLAYDYHKSVKDTLDFLWTMKDSEPLKLKRIPLWKGIQAPQLRDAAYEAAIAAHGLDNLPPILLEQITQAYTLQKELQGLSSPTVEILLQKNLIESNRRQIIIEQLVKDYCKAETKLIELYAQTLKSIRNFLKK